MVMVTGATSQRGGDANYPHEPTSGGGADLQDEEAALHERLVAYVHAIDVANDSRCGVWGEHSYARARPGAAAGAVRVLLGPRRAPSPSAEEAVDVERASPSPPPCPGRDCAHPPFGSDSSADDAEDEEEWEERLVRSAPDGEHARLASTVAAAMARVRLARLAGGRAAAAAASRGEAARLRCALAPLWHRAKAPQWLHAAMMSGGSARARRSYLRLLAALRRGAPRLAARLGPPPVPIAPAAPVAKTVDASMEPWLVWVGEGRWGRVLGARVHTRVVGAGSGAGVGAGAPEAWCAALAGAVRAAFADVLAEAGERAVVVGGEGGGAALALALAGAGARGALLLGPALRGARDGARGAGEGQPALLVVGGRAQTGGQAAAAAALGPRARLLLVAGADDRLRLPHAQLRRKGLTQQALDAAIAEECVRWMAEVAEAGEGEGETPPSPPVPHQPVAAHLSYAIGADSSEEEYAHLPASAAPPTPAPAPALAPAVSSGNHRSIEIVEGRVVSRAAGGTPLALMPPKRGRAGLGGLSRGGGGPSGGSGGLCVGAADILQMPVVFADDAISPTPAVKYTRVIVAKRGGGGGGGSGARPLLLRKGLRLVPRQ